MTTTATSTLEGTSGAAPPVARPVVGDQGRYTLGAEIARGGLGRIVTGFDRKLERPVAIKELLREDAHGDARFAVEALLTARLEHPSIVPVHDVGQLDGGRPFYAMKLVQGHSLANALAERSTLAARLELLPHVVDVADAIAYAHSRGVVHRDLKPQNVLIGSFGETVVIDWGLARLIDGADPAEGTLSGTPEYMAPEQALGAPLDRRFDVYGLGAVLHHLITGEPPLRRTPGSVREQVVAGPRAPIVALVPDAPRELVAITERAMARDPAQRYAGADELALELKRYREGQRVRAYDYTSREILWRWVRRWRFALIAAAVALVSLVAALVVVARDRATLADALASAEQREHEALVREGAANTREGAAEQRERDALRRADTLRVDQARLEAESDPRAALALLSQLSPGFADFGRARVIAAAALAHESPRVLGPLEGGRFELAFAPDGTQVAWAAADGTVRTIEADGRREVRANLGREGTSAVYSDDGATIAVGSGDGAVHVLAARDAHAAARRLGAHGSQIIGLAFSPDGTKLASAATEPGVHVWDLASGEDLLLASEDHYLFGLVWSRDGQRLAVSGDSATITVHDVAAAKVRVYDAHGLMASVMEFTPDGTTLFAQDQDGRIELVTLATGEARQLDEGAASFALAPDGKSVALWRHEGIVELFDVAALDKPPIKRLTCGGGGGGAGFGAGGAQLVVSSRGALCAFATDTWERTLLTGHDGGVLHTYIASAGRAVADIDGAGRLLLHRADAAPAPRAFTLGAPVNEVACTPDGGHVGATAGDAIYLIDVAAARVRALAELPRARRTTFSPDGTLLAASGASPYIVLHDLESDTTRELRADTASYELAFSPDGTTLASAGRDGGVRVLDVERGTSAIVAVHGESVRALAWSHDGRRLASFGYDRLVRVVDFDTGAETRLEVPGRLEYRVAFSDDDQLVAVSGDDGTCSWEVASGRKRVCDTSLGRALSLGFAGRDLIIAGALGAAIVSLDAPPSSLAAPQLRELGGHREVMHTAVSPESARLVTSDVEGAVRIWDLASGEGRLLAEHPGTLVATLAFSGNGEVIVSGGYDGRVVVSRDDLPLDVAHLRPRLVELGHAR